MPASITVNYPMPGATLPTTDVKACGNYSLPSIRPEPRDRNMALRTDPVIAVTLSKGSTSYTVTGAKDPNQQCWKATFANVTPDSGYIVTATITVGEGELQESASHSVETVEVMNDPPLIVLITCCPDQAKDGEKAHEVLPLHTTREVTIRGKCPVTATEILAIPQGLTIEHSQPSTHHRHTRYRAGPHGPNGRAVELKNQTEWEIKLTIAAGQFVHLILKTRDQIIGTTTSALY